MQDIATKLEGESRVLAAKLLRTGWLKWFTHLELGVQGWPKAMLCLPMAWGKPVGFTEPDFGRESNEASGNSCVASSCTAVGRMG